MKLVATILVLAFPVLAAAEGLEPFTGEWKGRGVYQLKGRQTNCGDATFGFNGTNKSIEFSFGHRYCDEHNETFDPVQVQYADGKLLFAGRQVGTYKDGLFQIGFRAPEPDGRFRVWRMSMRVEGNTLIYEESRTMEGESTPMISFAGIMKKD